MADHATILERSARRPFPRVATVPLALAGLHLAVVSAFAIAQPLLNLLGKYPAFFAAHNDSSLEVIAFAVVLLAGPPLVLLAVEALAGLVDVRLRTALHLAFIALLAALFFLQATRRVFPSSSWAGIAVALALGGAIAALYATESVVRAVASFLGFAPLVFGIIFIFFAPVSKLTLGGSAEAYRFGGSLRPPIFFAVFDAFPEKLMLDRRRTIDSARFPHLARLLEDATWYRNATTAHENTVFSVPSIVDGNWPHTGTQPIVADHPNSLFTLLGKGYDMNVTEVASNLCPGALCRRTNERSWADRMGLLASDAGIVYGYLTLPESLHSRLPPIDDRWQDFAGQYRDETAPRRRTPNRAEIIAAIRGGQRANSFRRAVEEIGAGAPELNFVHVLLPHEPREYLPDGRRYPIGGTHDYSPEFPPSYDNAYLSAQAWQRDILQSQFVDRLVGELVARLKQQGIYDSAMIVLVSDHGESFRPKSTPAPPFQPGKLSFRRAVTRQNIQDIAPVLLMVKYPGTGHGGIDDRWVKTIDILPSIAAALKIPLPFKVDGRSLLDPRYRGHREVRVERSSGGAVVMGLGAFERRRAASFARQLALFGSGSEARLYAFGPHRELVGRALSSLAVSPPGAARARIQAPEAWSNLDPRGPDVPAQITGFISGGRPEGRDIAVALNGRIVAVGETFKDLGPHKLNLSVVVPESAMRAGPNRLELYEVESGDSLRLLGTAGSSSRATTRPAGRAPARARP